MEYICLTVFLTHVVLTSSVKASADGSDESKRPLFAAKRLSLRSSDPLTRRSSETHFLRFGRSGGQLSASKVNVKREAFDTEDAAVAAAAAAAATATATGVDDETSAAVAASSPASGSMTCAPEGDSSGRIICYTPFNVSQRVLVVAERAEDDDEGEDDEEGAGSGNGRERTVGRNGEIGNKERKRRQQQQQQQSDDEFKVDAAENRQQRRSVSSGANVSELRNDKSASKGRKDAETEQQQGAKSESRVNTETDIGRGGALDAFTRFGRSRDSFMRLGRSDKKRSWSDQKYEAGRRVERGEDEEYGGDGLNNEADGYDKEDARRVGGSVKRASRNFIRFGRAHSESFRPRVRTSDEAIQPAASALRNDGVDASLDGSDDESGAPASVARQTRRYSSFMRLGRGMRAMNRLRFGRSHRGGGERVPRRHSSFMRLGRGGDGDGGSGGGSGGGGGAGAGAGGEFGGEEGGASADDVARTSFDRTARRHSNFMRLGRNGAPKDGFDFDDLGMVRETRRRDSFLRLGRSDWSSSRLCGLPVDHVTPNVIRRVLNDRSANHSRAGSGLGSGSRPSSGRVADAASATAASNSYYDSMIECLRRYVSHSMRAASKPNSIAGGHKNDLNPARSEKQQNLRFENAASASSASGSSSGSGSGSGSSSTSSSLSRSSHPADDDIYSLYDVRLTSENDGDDDGDGGGGGGSGGRDDDEDDGDDVYRIATPVSF